MDMNSISQKQEKGFWHNPLVWICLIGVGYWLYNYHLEHALGFLPYAILLLCPLMHMFMHKGHGGHGGNDGHSEHCDHPDHQKNPNEESKGGHNAQ